MTKRYKITGSITLRIPFQWVGEVDDEDYPDILEEYTWDELVESSMVEDAIQNAILEGNFDRDPEDIEIESVKRAKKDES